MVDGPAAALAHLDGVVHAPVRLSVCGRPGAGRRTVTEALLAAGATLAAAEETAEVALYVFVETPTDEDRDALAAMAGQDHPCLAVLNKADLSGFRGGDPMAEAARRCRWIARSIGVPAAPLAALTACAGYRGLDDVLLVGLRTLIVDPALLNAALRGLLLGRLDYYGLAQAVAALRAGATADGVAAALRRASGMDGVLAAVDRAATVVRYRRLTSAWAALACRAARHEGLAASLAEDAAVMARAAAAADVLRAAGLSAPAPGSPEVGPEIGPGEAPAKGDCLRAAVRWHRYAGGPVRGLHRDCARDLSRAWLRRWAAL